MYPERTINRGEEAFMLWEASLAPILYRFDDTHINERGFLLIFIYVSCNINDHCIWPETSHP